VTTENLQSAYFASLDKPLKMQTCSTSMRSGVVEANSLLLSRRIAEFLVLCAILLATSLLQMANAQDVSGAWQKVRQGCQPGELTCQIKARFNAQNVTGVATQATTLEVYLSNDMTFDVGDSLVHSVALGAVDPGETVPVKMAFNLNLGVSASGSFLIAVDQSNSLAVYANPGPTGIILFDRSFFPNDVTISAGTRVRWLHKESGDDHTVTSGSCAGGDCSPDGLFTSGNENNALLFHDEFLHIFNNVGVFPYFCEVHGDNMTGTITVIP